MHGSNSTYAYLPNGDSREVPLNTATTTIRLAEKHEHEPPRKRTRCLRSCLACRRAKQRCQLPDSFVEPSQEPMPSSLACIRCRLLEQSCFVVDSVPRSGSTSNRPRKATKTSESVSSQLPAQSSAVMQHPSGLPSQAVQTRNGVDDLSSKRLHNTHEEGRSVSETENTPPPMNDLRIFEPESTAEGEEATASTNISDEHAIVQSSPVSKTKRSGDWMKVGRTVCRPFELLGYLLKRQPITQQHTSATQVTSTTLVEVLGSVPDIRSRYEAELQILQVGMPFLPSFDQLWNSNVDGDLLMAVVVYMTFLKRHEKQWQAKILPILKQQCLSCLVHSPRSIYDILALTLTALYFPLLLGSISDGNYLEGIGLLTSASSASRSMELDQCYSSLAMQVSSPLSRVVEEVSKEARNAALWTSLCLYSGFIALAADVDRPPLVKCSSADLDALQNYSDSITNSTTASIHAKRQCASLSLLVYRTRATNEIREISQKYSLLMMDHRDDMDRSVNISILQALINESKTCLQLCCDGLKREKYLLAKKLATSYGWQKNYCMDVLGLDLALLQFLCLSRFAEKLFERSPMLIGPNSTPTDLLACLHNDIPLQNLYTTVGCHRADIAKHVLALLINTIRHADVPPGVVDIQQDTKKEILSSSSSPLNLLLSTSPIHFASSIVMAAQAITEELDGRITDGKSPNKRIGDATMEMGEMLLHGTSQALLQLGGMLGSTDVQVKEASLEGNLLVLSARLTDSLTRRVMAWKGVTEHHPTTESTQTTPASSSSNIAAFASGHKGLNNHHQYSNNNSNNSSFNNNINGGPFHMSGFSPDSFEDLFREILSTPIEFL